MTLFNGNEVWEFKDRIEKLSSIEVLAGWINMNFKNTVTITTQDNVLLKKEAGMSKGERILATVL